MPAVHSIVGAAALPVPVLPTLGQMRALKLCRAFQLQVSGLMETTTKFKSKNWKDWCRFCTRIAHMDMWFCNTQTDKQGNTLQAYARWVWDGNAVVQEKEIRSSIDQSQKRWQPSDCNSWLTKIQPAPWNQHRQTRILATTQPTNAKLCKRRPTTTTKTSSPSSGCAPHIPVCENSTKPKGRSQTRSHQYHILFPAMSGRIHIQLQEEKKTNTNNSESVTSSYGD